ncbi:hypothetical protein LguiA_029766 [Lonicera macranthoides]
MEMNITFVIFYMLLLNVVSNGSLPMTTALNYHVTTSKLQSGFWPNDLPALCGGPGMKGICEAHFNMKGCTDYKCTVLCFNKFVHVPVARAICESPNSCLCCIAC